MQGIVKFFKPDRGWGVLVSADVPHDVWIDFSTATGFRSFQAGDVIEFELEPPNEDSFHCVATRARLVRHGRVPTFGRDNEQLILLNADQRPSPDELATR